MKERWFWLCVSLCTAASVHLAYVLFAPGLELGERIAAFRDRTGTNVLALVDGDPLFAGSSDPSLLQAACLYDLGAGPVRLHAAIPDSYWSLEVYSAKGVSLYNLNDRQARAEAVDLVLRRRDGTADPEDAAAAGAIVVDSPSDHGLVVMRAKAVDQGTREEVRAVMARTTCAPDRAT